MMDKTLGTTNVFSMGSIGRRAAPLLAAGIVALVALAAGPAVAQDKDDQAGTGRTVAAVDADAGRDTAPGGSKPTSGDEVLRQVIQRPDNGPSVLGETAITGDGSGLVGGVTALPFTGGAVVTLVMVGVALLATGSMLLRGRRP
ncbi:MAG: hypothetical protein H0U16_00900 [Actinobacteria bacterium]|nr:hypothetical protein [Actinomycetota bacterium]